MSRILVTAWFYPGALLPITTIAEELRNRGHEVSFYAASRARPFVVERGFAFCAMNPVLDAEIERMFGSEGAVGNRWDRLDVVGMMKEFFVDTIPGQVEDIRQICETWQPEAILCEPAMWGPRVIVNEMLGLPLGLLDPPAATVPGPTVGIPGLGLPRPSTALHRLIYSGVRLAFEHKVKDLRGELNNLRSKYGLRPLPASLMEMAAHLPLVMVQSCPEFDYMRTDLPSNHHYVGFCTRYPPSTERLFWLSELSENRRKVHVSEGTMYTGDPLILKAAAEGLRDANLEVIMTTGSHREPEALGLGNLPPHFAVRKWIPYSELLPLMDVAVTHGGGGSIIALLAAGIPSVVVPLMWDQPENARRAEFVGAAIRLPAKKCTPNNLRRAVEEVIQDPRYRENARRLARYLSKYGGAVLAAELFERHVLRIQPPAAAGARCV